MSKILEKIRDWFEEDPEPAPARVRKKPPKARRDDPLMPGKDLLWLICFLIALFVLLPFTEEVAHSNLLSLKRDPPKVVIEFLIFTGFLLVLLTNILFYMRRVIALMALLTAITLGVNEWRSAGYGFSRLAADYGVRVTKLKKRIMFRQNMPQLGESTEFMKALNNSQVRSVRNFAVIASQNFRNDPSLPYECDEFLHHLSIFKTVNDQWKYISDPFEKECFATAGETIRNGMAGDCDDYTILMVSLICAVGGKARIIKTYGHVYPEVCLPDGITPDKAKEVIANLFCEGDEDFKLHYRTGNSGEIWLNFERSEYPGGPYMHKKVLEIIDKAG